MKKWPLPYDEPCETSSGLHSARADQRQRSIVRDAGCHAYGKGDFLIGNTAVHVTTAPSEALIRKCGTNLDQNYHAVIVTTEDGARGASALATNAGIADRIDILEIEQFMVANVLEWTAFDVHKRSCTMQQIVDVYNQVIDDCETDPSLKIALG